MSSPWDALARNVGRAPSVQELESLVTGTSSLNRALQFGTDGEPGGVIGDRPSTPESDKKPSPPTGGSFVSVVFVVRGAGLDVCGGKIGEDDAKFCPLPCLADQNSCGRFIKHVKVKASLACPAYYIGATSKQGGGAFCHPALVAPHSGFSAVATSVMRDTTIPRTVAEWREVFTVLSGFESFSPSEQRKVIDRINTKIRMGPTPMKPRKLINLSDSLEEMSDATDASMVKLPDIYSGFMLGDDAGESSQNAMSKIQSTWNEVI